jgi:membrane-bound lytic murein transglycosylase D
VDLRLVAETIDTDLESLRGLNPELLRLVTPPDPDFVLRLPEGSAERFFAEIAAIPPEKWVSWRRHKVEQGETLSSIAKQYRVSPAEVADANDLTPGSSLEEGQKLIIPAAARAEASTGKLIRYRVRRTDTLSSIADEFDVTTAELRKWNHLRADRVARGVSLRIYPGGMTLPPAQQQAQGKAVAANTAAAAKGPAARTPIMEARPASTVVHRVKPGETLWSIARAYQTTVEAIQAGNRFLFSRPLQVGDTLTILPAR